MTPAQLLQLREEVTSRERGDPIRDAYDDLLDSMLAKHRPLDWAKVLLAHGWVNRVPKGRDELS
jgi:hypothetical protein